MKRKLRSALILTAVMLICSGCSLRLRADRPDHSDMPLSGGNVGIGYHDDACGYHIVNRYSFVQPSGYEPKLIPHSYQSLSSDSLRELYELILNAAYCFSDKASAYEGELELRPLILGGTDYKRKDVESALIAVIDDHPEIFWMATDFDLTADEKTDSSELIINSCYTAADVLSMMRETDDALREFYANLPSGLSPYEREEYVYRYIIDNTVYDEDINSTRTYGDEHPSLFNLYGVMVDHKAVCEGYAYSFDYLCSGLGVDTVCICGTTDSEKDKDVGEAASDLHIWNAVELDGDWYMVDCTWDDLDNDEDYGEVYTYLNDTDEIMSIDHRVDKTYAQLSDEEYQALTSYVNNFLPPPCTATKYCYYLNESVRLTSADAELLADGIVEAVRKNRTSVMLLIDNKAYTPDTMSKALFEGDQPYYKAMELANQRLLNSPLDAGADAVYYPIYDLNMLAFRLNYK